MVEETNAAVLIALPAAGSAERDALVRRVASSLWASREQDVPLDEAGEYWRETFQRLAANAVGAIEQHALEPRDVAT